MTLAQSPVGVKGEVASAAVLPEIHIGPITLQTFGICFGLAFIASGVILWKRLKELGKPPDWAYEIIFSGLIGGLVGARVDYLVENYDKVSDDLLGNLFSGSGLVWLGGLLGGAAGVVIWAWRRGFLGVGLLDLCAVPLAVGYAVGRIGCQLSGDGDYGVKSDLPWAMSYPDGTVPTTDRVHPTPIYETLAMLGVAAALWRLRDRARPGMLFALYLVLAGVERLLVEFIRRNDDVALGLTLPQLISVGMILVGAGWVARERRAGRPVTAGA
ncbi:MAG: phosphatidylglycerol---prolipoprotein diacylglyceryl transferase [Actinomycetota bacterium]|nr:phosphatidylglycerol---prolipoprotein diacylglyceryl transferase [Actinomycetota bacterium]